MPWEPRCQMKNGANDRNRTDDLLITSELLYRLSYVGSGKGITYPFWLESQAHSPPDRGIGQMDHDPPLGWIRRVQPGNPSLLSEQSRQPQHGLHQAPQALERAVLSARQRPIKKCQRPTRPP